MWHRYGQYLTDLKDDAYRNQVFAYIEKEDSSKSLIFQIDCLKAAGFGNVEILHKNSRFATFGGVKRSKSPTFSGFCDVGVDYFLKPVVETTIRKSAVGGRTPRLANCRIQLAATFRELWHRLGENRSCGSERCSSGPTDQVVGPGCRH
jgi:hypothetical protein